MRRRLVYALLLAVALAASGCVQGQRGLSRAAMESRANSRVEAYQVVEAGLGALEDGYTFRNEQFRFEFDSAFDQVPGYETKEARHERGVEASDVLNASYEFVRDLFGVTVNKQLRVVVAPTVLGEVYRAYTRTSWETTGTPAVVVEGSQTSVLYFSRKAFEDPAALAHEMTHALLDAYRLPVWFEEGITKSVEAGRAKGPRANAVEYTIAPIGLDSRGHNVIQSWRGHSSELSRRDAEAYASAHAIIREISKRYGADVYQRFFQELLRTKAHLFAEGMSLPVLVDTFNSVTGTDVTPFFAEIQFDVSSL